MRNFTIITAGEFASIEDIINAYRKFVGNSDWWKEFRRLCLDFRVILKWL